MRAIWKGAVAFGLVNVPVKLYAATGETGVTLHQVHEKDGGRIHYRKVCSVDGEEVPAAEIAKGYETDGRMVVLTDQDLAELPLSTEREISVEEFVPAEQVDPIMLAKTYYLEPETTAAKPYALLREALRATERMAVVKVALRQREQMAVLRVRGDVICLQTLLWPDEIREADFPVLEAEVTVRPQEQAMAASLVESLAGEFDPSDFTDAYRGALEALIEGKVSAGATVQTPVADLGEQGEGGEVIDLLAALQRSIDKARAGKSTDGAREPAPREARGASAAATGTRRPRAKAPSAGAPAAKAPASKAAASTAPASKAAATKATGTKATPARKVGATTASAAKPAASKVGATKATVGEPTPRRSRAKATAGTAPATKAPAAKASPAQPAEEKTRARTSRRRAS